MAVRARVLRELATTGVLPQVTRWPPVFAGWLLSVAVLAWKAGDIAGPADAATLLRVVAVLLATSVVALVDDAAASVLAPAPVPLAWRQGVRFALASLAVAVPWTVAVLWVRPGDLTAALTLECAALTAVALAVASGIARWSDARDPSVAAGPAVLGLAVLALFLPPRWALFAPPCEPIQSWLGPLQVAAGQQQHITLISASCTGWRDAHMRWATVLALAVAVLFLTLRDPARPRARPQSLSTFMPS